VSERRSLRDEIRSVVRDVIRRAVAGAEATPPLWGEGSNLFGLPIIVIGEGFAGYYVSHTVFRDSAGEEWWDIRTGVFDVVAVLRIGSVDVPIVIAVGGIPTMGYVSMVKLVSTQAARIVSVYLHGTLNYRTVRVRRVSILNLDDAMSGRDMFLLLDPYGATAGYSPRDIVMLRKLLHQYSAQLNSVRASLDRCLLSLELVVDEADQLRSMFADVSARYRRVKQRLRQIEYEVDKLKNELQFWQSRALVSDMVVNELKSSMIAIEENVREALDQLTQMSTVISSMASTATKRMIESAKKVWEEEEARKALQQKKEEEEEEEKEEVKEVEY